MKYSKNNRWSEPDFSIWWGMVSRCHRQETKAYAQYGARGITVCDHWRFSYDNFIADMGCRLSKEYSIDRIDTLGNYEPSNCRWATRSEQSQNQTKTRLNPEIVGYCKGFILKEMVEPRLFSEAIARDIGCSFYTVESAIRHKTWRNVDPNLLA